MRAIAAIRMVRFRSSATVTRSCFSSTTSWAERAGLGLICLAFELSLPPDVIGNARFGQ